MFNSLQKSWTNYVVDSCFNNPMQNGKSIKCTATRITTEFNYFDVNSYGVRSSTDYDTKINTATKTMMDHPIQDAYWNYQEHSYYYGVTL